ncbi:sialate O-acetylesterase [Photobacterium kishitanii]|uniref:sialate O-acetylesterase n=1 Tax=Photobacterium kishitanii TaxID=318456 RepID=UPI0009B9B925
MRELEDKYHSAMKVLNQKNKTIVLRGVLWHQGESDSNSKENENAYYHNLYSVIKKNTRIYSL